MAVKKSKSKSKSKEWFTIIAPKLFEERELGRTMVSDPQHLVNRKISLNLLELTNNFNKFYMKFTFRVTKLEGNKAFTEFDSSECMQDYISRMVLRRVRRIDTVQDLKTKDGISIRFKGLGIISKRVKSSIQKVIRSRMKDIIKSFVESSTFNELIESILDDGLKNYILKETRRIYPVRNFEVRKTQVSQ
jgi:small subunit ribosomal protein S3Ae